MSFDISTLITDRTALDVTQKTAKGRYTASDLNRIGKAVNYVAKQLRELGHDVWTAQKASWMDKDWMDLGQAELLLKELTSLRNQIPVFTSTPETPATMERLGYAGANSIEQILVDLDAAISLTRLTLRRADALGFYAGADPLPTENRFEGRTWAEVDALELDWEDWSNATFFQLLYGAFGLRTWAELEALGWTWNDWNRSTFLALAYEKF